MEINGRISVFGGRNITPEVYENSVEIGCLLAQEGFLVLRTLSFEPAFS